MEYNHTLSAILRGIWLVDLDWANAHVPVVLRMLKGEAVNLGQPLTSQEELKEAFQMSAAGYKVGYYTDVARLPQNSVAIVDLVGPVVRYGGMCSYGLEDKANLMRKLYNSPNISGIVLATNTPGGEASGTAMFADVIGNRNKPVYAHVEDGMCASAGMWIVSQCDGIYASNKQSSFGSIGAYTMLPDWNGYFESEGLKIHEIYAPQSVDKNKDYRDALKGDYSSIEERLAELVDNFKESVLSGRNGKIRTKGNEPFTGKMYSANAAKTRGLIDGIASLEEVIQMAGNKKKSSNKSQNMAEQKERPHLAKTAGWAEGAQSDEQGNVTLSDTEADTVETALALGSENAQKVTDLEAKNTKLSSDLQVLTTERDNIQSQLDALKEKPDNNGSHVAGGKDEDEADGGKGKKLVDPVTAEAMKIYERSQKLSLKGK